MNVAKFLVLFAVVVATVSHGASAACYTFYEGLCPGPVDCMCTLGEACGVVKNFSRARSESGGCSGSCRTVEHNACPGPSDCLADLGSCGAPPPPNPPPGPGPGPSPSRDAIIQCAQKWVYEAIPYCQCNGPEECCGNCPYCGTFRCDCSGFVSYCLGLAYGYTTETLPTVCHEISKGELQKGDIMLCQGDHVVFFGGWTDSSQSHYVAYQEPGCHTSGPHHAMESVVPYPFDWNPSCFIPYRKNGLEVLKTPVSNMASKEALLRALMSPQSFPSKHRDEAAAAAKKLEEHKKMLAAEL